MELDKELTLVIFGATGDLNRRKLIPSLFELYTKGLLPESLRIIGFARREFSRQEYRSFLLDILRNLEGAGDSEIQSFVNRFHYLAGDFTNSQSYKQLGELIHKLDVDSGGEVACSNKLLYLGVPPSLYESMFTEIANAGLSVPCTDHATWTRVLVEKPFGSDLKSARALEEQLSRLFSEEQIFRIDHYLAKENLENILSFRFSNLLFDPVWNKSYVERIHIRLWEEINIEGRGSFYNSVGSLRDVAENHALQMLALITMENPNSSDPDAIRLARATALENLIPLSKKLINEQTLKGQYDGYTKEENVPEDSLTSTYFKIKTELKTPRWEGVPIILEGGKALSERRTDITVYFKDTPTCVCDDAHMENHAHANTVTFSVAPKQEIRVLFWAKKPGSRMEVEPKEFLFEYDGNNKDIFSEYAKLLRSAFLGDQSQFTSSREAIAAWKFITPIISSWEERKPFVYEEGSDASTFSFQDLK